MKLFDRTDGSFFRPSPSATAEHCIGFWGSIDVPDEIVSQVENAYASDRAAEIESDLDDAMNKWSESWALENPEPKRQRDKDERDAKYRQEYFSHREAIRPDIEGKRPAVLGYYSSRQLVRAFKMMQHRPSGDRFPEEHNKVLDHPIELFDETLTVLEIEEKYQFARIASHFDSIVQDNTNESILNAVERANDSLHTLAERAIRQDTAESY